MAKSNEKKSRNICLEDDWRITKIVVADIQPTFIRIYMS